MFDKERSKFCGEKGRGEKLKREIENDGEGLTRIYFLQLKAQIRCL